MGILKGAEQAIRGRGGRGSSGVRKRFNYLRKIAKSKKKFFFWPHINHFPEAFVLFIKYFIIVFEATRLHLGNVVIAPAEGARERAMARGVNR